MTVLFLGVVGDMRPEIDSHNRTPSIIAMITDAETSITRMNTTVPPARRRMNASARHVNMWRRCSAGTAAGSVWSYTKLQFLPCLKAGVSLERSVNETL